MWSYERGSSDRKYCVRAKFTVPGKCLGKLKDSRGASIKYGSQIAQHVWISLYLAVADAKEDGETTDAPESIYTFIEGRHIKPIKVPVTLINTELRNEWFGAYLAKTKDPALTLKDLIATLRDYTWWTSRKWGPFAKLLASKEHPESLFNVGMPVFRGVLILDGTIGMETGEGGCCCDVIWIWSVKMEVNIRLLRRGIRLHSFWFY